MELDEIKEKMLPGDVNLIAKLCNYNPVTVRSQLNGNRTLTDKVKTAAELVIVTRENMLSTQI